jgi:hypothetical protein
MKIFTGKIPEDCQKCRGLYISTPKCLIDYQCENKAKKELQLSILNQCVGIGNIDNLADEWRNATTIYEPPYKFVGTFSQFLESEIKKDGKDGKDIQS